MTSLGKMLILLGAFIVLAGILITVWDRIPFLGKLPGDIFIKKGNISFYFPLITSIVLSLILTVLINIFLRFFGK